MAGEESASAMEADIIINAADGLPNMHPNLEQLSDGELRGPDDVDIHDDDLPTSLIVTNLNSVVFKSDDEKVEHNSIDFISTHSLANPFSPTASCAFSLCGNGKVHFVHTGGSAFCRQRPLWTQGPLHLIVYYLCCANVSMPL